MYVGYLLLLLACTSEDKITDTSSGVDTGTETTDTTDTTETTDTTDTTDTEDGTTTTPHSALVDPECIDGQYSEILPTPNADITSVVGGYSSSDPYGFIDDVLGQRFATGQYLFVNGYVSQGNFPDNCLNYFLGDRSSASAVIPQLSTIVHECGHFLDMSTGGWGENGYHFTEDLLYTCSDGRTPDNGGGRTFG